MFAAEPPEQQHVEENVQMIAGVVQEGVGEQPPDLAVKDHLIDVQQQGVGERLGAALR